MTRKPAPAPARSRRIGHHALRVLRAVVASLVVAFLLAWYLLETEAAAERVRRLLEARGSAALGETVSIGRLELDIVPPRVEATDVVVGDPATPRFAADRARLEIGAVELVRPELSIENLELDRPRLNLDLPWGGANADGSASLPASPIEISIHRAKISDGSITVAHATAGITGEVFGIELGLQPEGVGRLGLGTGRGSGRLSVASGQLDLSGRNGASAVLTPLELTVDYGTRPSVADLDSVRLSLGDSVIHAEGNLRALDTLDLQLEADVALQDIFRVWVPPGPDDHTGRATFAGTLQVRDGAPVVAGRLRADDVRFTGLDLEEFRTDLQLRRGLVTLRNTRGRAYGGEYSGTLRVDSGISPARLEAELHARGIDAAGLTAWEPLGGLRLAGTLDGDVDLAWSVGAATEARGEASLRLTVADLDDAVFQGIRLRGAEHSPAASRHLAPSLPLPGSIALGVSIGDGLMQLREATVELPRTALRARGTVDFDGALAVELSADSEDLRLVDHLAAQIRSVLAGNTVPRLGVRGRGRGTVSLTGTLDDPRLAGTVTATEVAIADLRIGNITSNIVTVGGMIATNDLRIERRGGVATGRARLRMPGSAVTTGTVDYAVELDLRDYDASVDLQFVGPEWLTAARLDGQVALRGTFDRPLTGSFRLRGRAPVLAEARFDALTLSGRKAETAWILDEMGLDGADGQLRGSMIYGTEDRQLDLDAQLDGLDLAQLAPWFSEGARPLGRLTGTLRSAGRTDALSGESSLRWTGAAVGGVALGEVAISARADAGVVAARLLGDPATMPTPPGVARTTVAEATPLPQPPPDGWSASATLETRAPYGMAARVAAEAELARVMLLPLGLQLPADLEIRGRADLDLNANLGDLSSLRGSGRVTALQVARGDFRANAEVLRATVSDSLLAVEGALTTDAGTLTLSPRIDLTTGTLSGSLGGSVPAAVVHLLAPGVDTAGEIAIEAELGGTTGAPNVRGALIFDDLRLDAGWPYPLTVRAATLQLGGGRVAVTEFEGGLGDRELDVAADLALDALTGVDPDAVSSVRVQFSGLPLEPLLQRSPAVYRLVNRGTLSAQVDLSGPGLDPRAWSGTVQFDETVLRLQQYRAELVEPITARVAGRRLRLPDGTRMRGGRTDFTLAGSVGLDDADLDLRAVGTLGFEALNVLSPYWGTGGVADLDLRIYGGGDDLAYQGKATLSDVVLSPPPLRQPIEDIAARLEFQDRRVVVTDLSGSLGGGEVTGSGEIFLRNNFPQSFRLAVDVDNALIRLERDVRFAASASVVHDGTPERSILSGRIDLHEASYRRDYDADRALLDLLDAPETEPDPFLQSISLALDVEGSEDLFIDNNLADVEVTADFEIRGNAARPVVLGRSTILAGRLFWNGNNFDVLQGTVEFNNPFETEPTFEVRARTEIRSYTVDMRFSGSLVQGVAFDYTSTPTLSDLELFNLLAFGEDPDSEVLQNRDRYQQALGLQATRYLADAYFSEVESGAQRLFGVDRFRISPTISGRETDATARLTLGKRINRNLYLTYSRLLSSSEDQLVTVEYQLSPRVRIKGTRDEDGSFGVDFLVSQRIRR